MKLTIAAAALAFVAAAEHDGQRLIRLADDRAEWMTPDQIADLALREIGYLDDTNGDWQRVFALGASRQAKEVAPPAYPAAATFPKVVKSVNAKIRTADLQLSLESFVNQFQNRIYNSTEGKQSCGWIYDQVVKASASANGNVKVSVRKFDHAWGQYSVIARVEPVVAVPKQDIVIVSAHQDSINWKDWKDPAKRDIAPGADDDGSGTVTILESLKYLLATPEWTPVRPVEFHWYSAEEWGLLGSKEVATEYATANKQVYAQMQQDMTGWVRPGTTPVVSLVTDFTNKDLTSFLETLVVSYLSIPASRTTCGYGCSDHFSWNKTGYPGSMPFETNFKDLNKNIHTANDTVATIDFTHMAEFTKLTNAYIVELTQDSATSC